nr:ScpA family protein [Streptomyces ambofaciens]
MTSNDAPRPGARAGRRRALGTGPGGPLAAPPVSAEAEEAPPGSGTPAPTGPEDGGAAGEARSTSATPEPPALEASEPEPEPEREPVVARSGTGAPVTAPVSVPPSEAGRQTSAVAPGAWPRGSAVGPEAGPQGPAVAPEAGGAGYGPARPESLPGAAEEPPGSLTVPGAGTGHAPAAPAENEPGEGDGVFKVRLANFEGPFDLLLQLISKHKMDVTEVALSKVTDEFMAHIRARGPDWDLDETTEFLVVAATLLDLKAARLLPAAEVEDEADLALLEARDLLFARLLQYRAFKQIAAIFNERLEAEARRHPRTVGLEPHHAELLPEVVISIGPEGFAELAVKAMQPKPRPQVYVEHIHAPLVSVQEQAGIVVARLKELGETSFRVLVEDTDDTLTVVARFLALLELYREKAVALDQETALGDLLVRWTGPDGDAEPVVTDEFDRPPLEAEEERKA